jgi:hypothetical protein
VYPVRLIDIEVAGGLQFHLELSQWVDFFPSPTIESYDRLADAIRTGAKQTNIIRRRYDPRRWAAFTLIGVAALIVGTLLSLQWYSAWQEKNYEEIFTQEQARINEENAIRDAESRAEALRTIDVNPTFVIRGGELFIQSLYKIGFPPNTDMFRIEVAINEGAVQVVPYPVMSQFRLDVPIREIRSIVFTVTDETGSIIARLDKTRNAQQVLRPLVEGTAQTIRSIGAEDFNDLHCSIGGCEIQRSIVCDAGVTSVRIAQSGETFDIPPDYCDEASSAYKYCLPAQVLPFNLTPGQPVEFIFGLIDGSDVRINQPVNGWMYYQNEQPGFHRIASAPGNEDAPPLFLSYTPPGIVVGQLNFVLGWGSCNEPFDLNQYTGQADATVLLADLDGRGLVPSGNANIFSLPFSPGDATRASSQGIDIALMTQQVEISFAIGSPNGISSGPWTYSFDFSSSVAESLPPNSRAEVRCTQDGNSTIQASGEERDYCYAVNPEAFLGVDFVEFGSSPGLPYTRVAIDFTPEEYVSGICSLDEINCPLKFEVPQGWTEVYSRVTMKSGQQFLETRHLRPRE